MESFSEYIVNKINKNDNSKELLLIISGIKNKLNNMPKKKISVAINQSYGGFNLSEKAIERFNQISNNSYKKYIDCCEQIIDRTNRYLIKVIKELGREANGMGSSLAIKNIELAPGQYWRILEYDGVETIEILWEKKDDYRP